LDRKLSPLAQQARPGGLAISSGQKTPSGQGPGLGTHVTLPSDEPALCAADRDCDWGAMAIGMRSLHGCRLPQCCAVVWCSGSGWMGRQKSRPLQRLISIGWLDGRRTPAPGATSGAGATTFCAVWVVTVARRGSGKGEFPSQPSAPLRTRHTRTFVSGTCCM
jgi:hypothetical protein